MIQLIDIHKYFSGKKVLNGISFDIKKGEIVTLIGKIGCGKSTVVNLICGLFKPDKGQIIINNLKVNFDDRKYIRDIGFLLSGDYLIEDFSTVLYWDCIGKLLSQSKDYIKERIDYLVNLCEISDPKKPISQLSSGNRMLVKIGTMLLNEPQILIIDEPFIHLDMMEVLKIERILLECHNAGNTILLTTHNPESIFRISDKLLLLEGGIIKEQLFVRDYVSYDSFQNNLKDCFRKQ